MRAKPGIPRLEDVARHARVHSSTVSRYFSNRSVLSDATSQRIEAAVAELGYIPNLVAGSLASQKRRLVALLVANLGYSNFNEAIEEITSGLTLAGTNVMLCITGGSPQRSDQLITAALRWRIDAMIAWGTPITPQGAAMLQANGVTVLEISDAASTPIDMGIGFDEGEAGRALARFAYERGYVRPCMVATMGPYSSHRRDAFLAEWRGLAGGDAIELQIDPPANFQQGRRIFATIRRLSELPDVVVCASDYLAQAIVIEAQASGLRVPEDVAVIGLGNTPMSADMRPTLTTVDLHTDRIAAEALRVLDARGRGEELAQRHIDLGFTIVARESA